MTIATKTAGTSAGRALQLDSENAASGYLMRYCRGLERRDALENCTLFLMSEQTLTEERAEIVAIQAYAEIESFNQVAWIDAESTTASVVVLRTAGGTPMAFTVSDLIAAREVARDRGALRTVNQRPLQ